MNFHTEIFTAANAHGLDPMLIAGLVATESNFNPWAWNPEPAYRYLWNVRTKAPFRTPTAAEIASEFPPKDFPAILGDPDQEWWGQQASWGLMQLMGALAREHGFRGPYLPELCDPATNLEIGCTQLSALMTWAHGDPNQALSAYNGGKGGNTIKPFRNQIYATKVLAAAAALKTT